MRRPLSTGAAGTANLGTGSGGHVVMFHRGGDEFEAFKTTFVFSEMVALLWDSGQVNSAIEVEAMWNEMVAQYPFSLLCGYPVRSVSGDHHQDSLPEVCRVHSSVAGARPGHA